MFPIAKIQLLFGFSKQFVEFWHAEHLHIRQGKRICHAELTQIFPFSKVHMGTSPDLHGWSIVSIENIVISGDSIAYGLSSDEAFTGQPCRAKWFSATDFKLTRTGDLPRTKNHRE